MDNKYVIDSKTRKRYIYLTDIFSEEVQIRVESLPDVLKFKDGFLLPRTPSNNAVVRELSVIDGRYQARDELAKKEQAYQNLLNERADDYAVVDEVLDSIMHKKPIQGFPDSCPMLMNHQIGGTLIADRFDKFAFFYDTGTGKTLMALDIIRRKEATSKAHFLILCPKTIINTAWMEDSAHFFPRLRLLPLSNNITAEQLRKLVWQWRGGDADFRYAPCFFQKPKRLRDQKSIEYMLTQANHLIVNYELFNREPEKYLQIGSGEHAKIIDGIIIDESSVLKSGYTNLYEHLHHLIFDKKIKYLYLFSGKPAPNKTREYYPQIRLVASYLKLPPIQDIEKNADKYEHEFLQTIRKASITVSKKDCFDLPDKTEVVRKIELGTVLKKQYVSLARNLVTELESLEKDGLQNTLVYHNHVLASISKLRQFTGGFVKNENDIIHVHSKKLEELKRVIEELGREQAIIWCQFKHEVKEIVKMLTDLGYPVVTAYSETRDKDASINAFKNGDATFMIAHPRTMQYGVTLTNCCYAIYYSTSYSFEEYYQSHDRIYRKGQTLPCTYIFIQAENSIDEVMFRVIMEKKDTTERTEMFLKHMRNAANE